MSLLGDIARTYGGPATVVRRRLSGGADEGRSLAVLMAACLAMYLAQWPRLLATESAVPTEASLMGALLGWMFLAPLGLYLLAALAHVGLAFTGRAGAAGATRFATFWALLAAAPLFLAQGVVLGLLGQGPLATSLGLAGLLALIAFWAAGLSAARDAR